jgi:tetratricopeptide (TPR) repeat protein
LEGALALHQDVSQRSQAEGLLVAGDLVLVRGEIDVADRYLGECLRITRAAGYDFLTGCALVYQSGIIHSRGDPSQARRMLEEALLITQNLGDKGAASLVLLNMGVQSKTLNNISQAQRYYEQSLELSRAAGEIFCNAASLNNLAGILYIQGDLQSAQELFEQTLVIQRQLRSKVDIANVLGNLGLIAIQKNEAGKARELEMESLGIRRQTGNLDLMAISFSGLASVLNLEDQPFKAALLQGYVSEVVNKTESVLDYMEQMDFDRTAASLNAVMGEDSYRQAFQTGKTLTFEGALALVN